MQFMRLADVPSSERDRVFRYSPARALFATFAAISIGGVLLLIARQQSSGLAFYLSGLLILRIGRRETARPIS